MINNKNHYTVESIFLDKIGSELAKNHGQKLVLASSFLQKPVLEHLLNRLTRIALVAWLRISLFALGAVVMPAKGQRDRSQRQLAAEGAVEKES